MSAILPADTVTQFWFPNLIAQLRAAWGSYGSALWVSCLMAGLGAVAIAALPPGAPQGRDSDAPSSARRFQSTRADRSFYCVVTGERNPWTGDSFFKAASARPSSARSSPMSTGAGTRTGALRRSRGSWCSTCTRSRCIGCARRTKSRKAAIEMVCGGVCPTVPPYPGHIDPARVAQELPGVRQARAQSRAARDADQGAGDHRRHRAARRSDHRAPRRRPGARITRSVATPTTSPSRSRRSSTRSSFASKVRPAEPETQDHAGLRHAPGPASVGGAVLDLLSVLKEFDPKFVGLHWDTGHMALHGDGMWETLMRHAGPYLAAVGWRDRGWVQDLGLLGEGGPYPGQIRASIRLSRCPTAAPYPGRPGAERAAARGGAGAVAAARRRGGRGGGRGATTKADRQGGRRGGGPARGPANSAGAGSIDANNPLYRSVDGEMPKRPIGGKNAKGGGWSAPNVAMGTGVVHIPRVATVLAEIGFNGPSELQSEYAGIGGAETGADKITPAAPVRHRHAEARRHHDSEVVRDGQCRPGDLSADREGFEMVMNRVVRTRGGRRSVRRPGRSRAERRPTGRRSPAIVGGMKYSPLDQITPANVAQAEAGVELSTRRRRRRSSSTT